MNKTKSIVAVMLSFFTMGFVDMIGIGSNYVQQDLALTDSQAGLMPSLLFFWFLVFSVPTGMLMKRIGKKKTVMLSIVVTAISLKLASTLTFGQFVKAIASFIAPYIAMWGATAVIPSFGLGWKVIFPIFALVTLITLFVLGTTQIDEKGFNVGTTSISECFKMLGDPFILFCFLCIVCHVGVDVGTNTYAPKILMARLGRTLDEAASATSIYFIFRTIGCLSGSFILRKMSPKAFFTISASMMAASMVNTINGSHS
jgi:fucose permease